LETYFLFLFGCQTIAQSQITFNNFPGKEHNFINGKDAFFKFFFSKFTLKRLRDFSLVCIGFYFLTKEYLKNTPMNLICNSISDQLSQGLKSKHDQSSFLIFPKHMKYRITFDKQNIHVCKLFPTSNDSEIQFGSNFFELFKYYPLGKIIIILPKTFSKEYFCLQYKSRSCGIFQIIIDARSPRLRHM
jgi:hypothetical protein